MSTSEAILRLLLATAVPTVFGLALVRLLLGARQAVSLYVAHGFLLGIALEIAVTRAFDLLHVELAFSPIIAVVVVLSAIAAIFSLRTARPEPYPANRSGQESNLRPSAIAVVMVSVVTLLGLVLVWLAAQEALLRPTYPWDAWRGWEPKTMQFFFNRSLDAPMATIGNYGGVSTTAQLWAMIATDSPLSPMTHLPWILAYLAVATSVYAYVSSRTNSMAGIIAAVAFISMPYAFTHAALSGYADLWLCLTFTLGLFSLLQFQQEGSRGALLLAVLYALLSVYSKRAGMGFGAIILFLLLIQLTRQRPVIRFALLAVTLAAITAAFLLLLAPIDYHFSVPGITELVRTGTELTIAGVGTYNLDAVNVFKPFFEALVQFSSWNIAVCAAVVFAAKFLTGRYSAHPEIRTLSLALLLSMLYLLGYFAFLSPGSAIDHTGLSRALLPVAPLLLAVTALLACARARRER